MNFTPAQADLARRSAVQKLTSPIRKSDLPAVSTFARGALADVHRLRPVPAPAMVKRELTAMQTRAAKQIQRVANDLKNEKLYDLAGELGAMFDIEFCAEFPFFRTREE